jgi:predicted acyl esterase
LGLPWHPGRKADVAPITPGMPVTLSFAFTPTARRIPAGHRLRLAVAGADHRQRNLAQIKVDPAPRITIDRGSESHINIPLVAPNALP